MKKSQIIGVVLGLVFASPAFAVQVDVSGIIKSHPTYKFIYVIFNHNQESNRLSARDDGVQWYDDGTLKSVELKAALWVEHPVGPLPVDFLEFFPNQAIRCTGDLTADTVIKIGDYYYRLAALQKLCFDENDRLLNAGTLIFRNKKEGGNDVIGPSDKAARKTRPFHLEYDE
jgi:hypothetical protein